MCTLDLARQQVERAQRNPRLAHVHEVVARSAMGPVGAVEIDLLGAQKTGIPGRVVTIDGSRVVAAEEWLIGAHRDIYHGEIATLVLLAAGQGSSHGSADGTAAGRGRAL